MLTTTNFPSAVGDQGSHQRGLVHRVPPLLIGLQSAAGVMGFMRASDGLRREIRKCVVVNIPVCSDLLSNGEFQNHLGASCMQQYKVITNTLDTSEQGSGQNQQPGHCFVQFFHFAHSFQWPSQVCHKFNTVINNKNDGTLGEKGHPLCQPFKLLVIVHAVSLNGQSTQNATPVLMEQPTAQIARKNIKSLDFVYSNDHS